MHELPIRVSGLLIAAIFAASQSTISSSLNSIAASWSKDFDMRIIRPNRDDGTYLFTAKWVVTVVGCMSTGHRAGDGEFGSAIGIRRIQHHDRTHRRLARRTVRAGRLFPPCEWPRSTYRRDYRLHRGGFHGAVESADCGLALCFHRLRSVFLHRLPGFVVIPDYGRNRAFATRLKISTSSFPSQPSFPVTPTKSYK